MSEPIYAAVIATDCAYFDPCAWDPFGTLRAALWIGAAQWAGKIQACYQLGGLCPGS